MSSPSHRPSAPAPALPTRRRASRTTLFGRPVADVVKFVSVAIIALVVVSPLILLGVASLKPDRFQILADMGSFRAFTVSDPSLQNYRDVATLDGPLPMGASRKSPAASRA